MSPSKAVKVDVTALEIVSRDSAVAQGKRFYFTGHPCKYGHIAQRYVSTGGCLGCLNRWKELGRRNPVSKELVPYVPKKPFWRSRRFTLEQLERLDSYLEQCLKAFTLHEFPDMCKACVDTRFVSGENGKWKTCEICAPPPTCKRCHDLRSVEIDDQWHDCPECVKS